MPRISELEQRVQKGVKAELLPLTRLEGVGRVRARRLHDAGLRTIENLQRAPLSTLVNLPTIGPRVAKRIKEQIGGLVKRKEWQELAQKQKAEQQALTEYYE